MRDTGCAEGLATLWIRVASDSGKRERFHELFGTFCHQCRNHLNSLKLSLYLARRLSATADSDPLSHLDARYAELDQCFDHLQAVYRPLQLTPVRLPLSSLFEEGRPVWTKQIGANGRQLIVAPTSAADEGEFDPWHLRQAFDAFVSWRARFGGPGERVSLRLRVEEGQFRVRWSEPESTVTDNRAGEGPDFSLAVPLLARVVAAHGGATDLSTRRGFELTLSWPRVLRHRSP